MRLRHVEVFVAIPVQILSAGALSSVATFPPLFSSIVLLFVGIVPTSTGFRPMTPCIEHLKYLMRLWLFYTNQPYLWLLGWLSYIPYVPPPEPHVMVAFGWLHPYSSHSYVDRSDQCRVAPVGRQFLLMFSGSLSDPDALGSFFWIPPVICWPTILPIHKKFRIVE